MIKYGLLSIVAAGGVAAGGLGVGVIKQSEIQFLKNEVAQLEVLKSEVSQLQGLKDQILKDQITPLQQQLNALKNQPPPDNTGAINTAVEKAMKQLEADLFARQDAKEQAVNDKSSSEVKGWKKGYQSLPWGH
jgi:hypothetical protein